MIHQYRDAALFQGGGDQCCGVFILAGHQARAFLYLRHLAAQTGKRLRQLTANGAATQDHEALGLFFNVPQGVGGEGIHVLDTGNRWNKRLGAGGDNNAAGGQAFAVITVADLPLPMAR